MANLLVGLGESTQAQLGSAAVAARPSKTFSAVLGPKGSKTCKYARKDDDVLGRGATSQAILVTRVSDGMTLVAKVMDLESMSANDRRYAQGEIRCLGECNHFAVLKLYDEAEENGMQLLICEFGDAGDLRRHIKARAAEGMRYFPERDVWQIFVQLCLAVDHVHSRRMLHRDIKSANVFLTSSGLVKVGDFGFSQLYDETVSSAVAKSVVGTPYYLAPELWRGERYSKKADMWSVGIILFELLALRRPFEAESLREIKQVVLAGKPTATLPSVYSDELQAMVWRLLDADPACRPSASEVLVSPQMARYVSTFEQNAAVTATLSPETKQHIVDCLAEFRGRSPSAGDILAKRGAAGGLGSAPGAADGADAAAAAAVTIVLEGNLKKESASTGVWKERRLQLDSRGLFTVSVPASRRGSNAEGLFAAAAGFAATPHAAAPSCSSPIGTPSAAAGQLEVSVSGKDIKNVFPVRNRVPFGFEVHLRQGGHVLRFQASQSAEQDRWISALQVAAGVSP